MDLSFLIYALLVFYFIAGYQLILLLWRKAQGKNNTPSTTTVENDQTLPPITVIIPCYNNADTIKEKLENTLQLDYPQDRLKILVVDQGSTDATVSLAQEFISQASFSSIRFLNPDHEENHPFNEALREIPGDHYVLITCAQTMVESPQALKIAAGLLRQNSSHGVVGGWANKGGGAGDPFRELENRMLYLENQCFSASKVFRSFYMFPRYLINFFPEDCKSSEQYISLLCLLQGKMIITCPEIITNERKVEIDFKEQLKKKLKQTLKMNHELLRFAYLIPQLPASQRFLYGHQLMQLILYPLVFLAFILESLDLIVLEEIGYLFVIYLLLALSVVLSTFFLPRPSQNNTKIWDLTTLPSLLGQFFLSWLTKFTNLFLYPFFR